jgi:hypothetical protein
MILCLQNEQAQNYKRKGQSIVTDEQYMCLGIGREGLRRPAEEYANHDMVLRPGPFFGNNGNYSEGRTETPDQYDHRVGAFELCTVEPHSVARVLWGDVRENFSKIVN